MPSSWFPPSTMPPGVLERKKPPPYQYAAGAIGSFEREFLKAQNLTLDGGTAVDFTVTNLTVTTLDTTTLDVDTLTGLSGVQGDVLYHNGTSWVRLAAGTAERILTTKGAGANPVWEIDPVTDLVTTKGDIVAATAADTLARVAVGADGTFLKADSGAASGVSWASAGAGSIGSSIAFTKATDDSTASGGSGITFSSSYLFAMGTNEVWAFQATFYFHANEVLDGIIWDFSIPASGGGVYGYEFNSYTAGGAAVSEQADHSVAMATDVINATLASAEATLTIAGRVTTAGTAGNVTFRYNKNSDLAGATLLLKAGSTLVATRQS